MVPDPLQRVRRLALAAQVAAGGPPRIPQLIAAGYVTPAAAIAVPPPRPRSAAASIGGAAAQPPAAIEMRSKEPEPSAGPLVRAFCEATGSRVPCEAWFVVRGVRRITDQMQTRAAQRCAAASRPLRVTQEKDSREAVR